MQRTGQVRRALAAHPELTKKIREIFDSHVAVNGMCSPFARGSSRSAYMVGPCTIAPDKTVQIILKLRNDAYNMAYKDACHPWRGEVRTFGAFEVYYDFVAGHLTEISFPSREVYETYRTTVGFSSCVPFIFRLDRDWGGAQVAQGDLGAVPYFQLVVRYKESFGILTEGTPPLVEPARSARDQNTNDDFTVEDWRIIDLERHQSQLMLVNGGGILIRWDPPYPDNFSLYKRGYRYFGKRNRLDIEG